jgi:hypothetical protein
MGDLEKVQPKDSESDRSTVQRRRWLLRAGAVAAIGGQVGVTGRVSAQSAVSNSEAQGALAGQSAAERAIEVIYDLSEEQLAQTRTDCSSRGSYPRTSYPTQRTTTTTTTTRTVPQPMPVHYPNTGMGQTCFVATVAFEDGNAPEIVELRRFRDEVLARYSVGQRFIRWYYRAGPGLSLLLGGGPIRRSLVRAMLRVLILCLPGPAVHR